MSIFRRYMLGESWETENGSANRQAEAALRKVLLRPGEVERALLGGQSAIDSSIEKWSRIQNQLTEISRLETLGALGPFIGAKTCALCIEAIAKYKAKHGAPKRSTDKCTFCPLARLQKCPEAGSYYSQIDEIVRNARDAPQLYYADEEVFDRMQILVAKLIELLKKL